MKTDTKQGVWDEKTKSYIKPSGTVKQGRRPMYKSFVTQRDEARAHADKLAEAVKWLLQRCDNLPTHRWNEFINLLAAYEADRA